MAVTTDATNIYVDNGTYSFADILAAVTGADMLRVDSGSGFPTYRVLKNIFVGQTAAGATSNATTLSDTKCAVTFDANTVLKTRTSNSSSLAFYFGTKIGTGNQASGYNGVNLYFQRSSGIQTVQFRGDFRLYGCKIQSYTTSTSSNSLQFVFAEATAEIVNCMFDGFSGYVIGTSGSNIPNIFNTDISADASASVVTAFFVDAAERITVSGTPGTSFLATATAGISFKRAQFYGTPGTSDLRWSNVTATNWKIVRPTWSGNGPKFSGGGPSTAATGAQEYWNYDVKVVDGSTGQGISGIPVKLTDADGNVQVNTTTDSTGQISFGSGLTSNAVVVMDHYSASGPTYQQHDRSPFLLECNLPSMTGYNDAYGSQRYYFDWIGHDTITTSSGSFEDVNDVIVLRPPSGNPTTWTECTL